MSWYGFPSGTAVFALDDGAEFFQTHLAFAHLQQSADDGPDHVAQETVGFDAEHQQSVLFQPLCLHDLAVVGLHLGVQLAEAGKVGVVKYNLVMIQNDQGFVFDYKYQQSIYQ